MTMPKLGKTEVWFISTALLYNEIYLPTIFMLVSLIVLELCPGQSSKCKNKQRAIIKNKARQSYGFYAVHTYSIRSIYLQSFMLIPIVV
jgi:hypothetical protein